MNLSVSPYTVIPRPKFGSKVANEGIAQQWIEWKADVKQVHDIFDRLLSKKKSMGEDSSEFKSFICSI